MSAANTATTLDYASLPADPTAATVSEETNEEDPSISSSEGLMVIGAGLSRTGTLTLKKALETLGYPCYHMTEMFKNQGDEHLWKNGDKAINNIPGENFDQLFRRYKAAVDYPAVGCFQEIRQHYKNVHQRDLKVILTVRKSAEKWYSSVSRTLVNAFEWGKSFWAHYFGPIGFYYLTLVMDEQMGFVHDRESCIDAYNRHNQMVMDTIPSDQLLVLKVEEDYSQGYDKLMDFLEVTDPELRKRYGGLPLPKTNESMRFHIELWVAIMTRPRPMIVVGVFTVVILAILMAFFF